MSSYAAVLSVQVAGDKRDLEYRGLCAFIGGLFMTLVVLCALDPQNTTAAWNVIGASAICGCVMLAFVGFMMLVRKYFPTCCVAAKGPEEPLLGVHIQR
jgi:hypothetical protein